MGPFPSVFPIISRDRSVRRTHFQAHFSYLENDGNTCIRLLGCNKWACVKPQAHSGLSAICLTHSTYSKKTGLRDWFCIILNLRCFSPFFFFCHRRCFPGSLTRKIKEGTEPGQVMCHMEQFLSLEADPGLCLRRAHCHYSTQRPLSCSFLEGQPGSQDMLCISSPKWSAPPPNHLLSIKVALASPAFTSAILLVYLRKKWVCSISVYKVINYTQPLVQTQILWKLSQIMMLEQNI